MKLRKIALIPAVTALALSAACGGGGGDGDDPADRQTQDLGQSGQVGEGQDASVQGPALQPEGAEEGGTLTVLTDGAPSTMDPTRAYYTDSTAILNLVTRGLTGFQRQEDGSMVLVPDLATDLGRVAEDGLSWEFTLKDGIKYNDGTDVVADDLCYAIKRSFAQDVLTSGPLYQNDYFLDADKYEGPYKDKGDYAGCEVVDDKTIKINLSRKFPDLPYYASFPMFTPIPEAKDTKLDYEREIMATGPYMIEDYRPQVSMTLVRNPEWNAESDPIRNQFPDGFEFQFSQDSGQLQDRIIGDNGEDQTVLTYDNILASKYRSLVNTEGGEDRLTTGTQPCTFFQYLDTRELDNVEVRKAIGIAYPTEQANQAGGLIPGLTSIPATGILPPGVPGKKDFDPLGNGGEGNGDPEAAKQILEDQDAVGTELKFYFQTDVPESVSSSEVVEQGLEEAGFKVTRVPTTSEQIRAQFDNPEAPINMRGSGWCSDWPSGASWFPAVFAGNLINPDSVPNMSFLDEPEVNEEIDRILSIEDPAEAAEAWGALDQLVMEKYYPVVVRYVGGVAMPHGSRVGNMVNDATRGAPDFPNLFVVPE
jgi:peptide/nickel transport system substrate-binding protein